MVQMFDNLPITGARLTGDGYLVSEVRASRTGIQIYSGVEVGRPQVDRVRVYRPEDEVFNQDSMASFAHRPVTINHPKKMVDSSSWKKEAVGYTGETITKDGGFVRVPLILADQAAISQVMSNGKRELSFGYTCDLDFTPGKTPGGEEYDAVQRQIRGNHLAIVSAGRAGPDCRFGDTADDDEGEDHQRSLDMAEKNLKTVTVMIDGVGIPVETTDAGATVIDSLNKKIANLVADNLKLVSDHGTATTKLTTDKDAVIADLNKKIGEKDAEIKVLKDASAPDKLEKLVQDRAELLSKVEAIMGDEVDIKGKSIADVRKMVVAKKMGDDAVKGRDDNYIAGVFDFLASQVEDSDGDDGEEDFGSSRRSSFSSRDSDPLRSAMRDRRPGYAARGNGYEDYKRDLQDAWKGPAGGADDDRRRSGNQR
jgi:hypothetical protein